MKTKFCLCLGAFATSAALLVLVSQGPNATAQVTTDQPAVQDEVRQPSATETRNYDREHATARHARGYKASELLGLNVRARTGDDDIGEIKDLMVGHDGKVIYAAVSFGGFLGVGEKMFAVPFDAIEFVRADDDLYARIDVSEQTLKNRQGFDQENWPDQPNRDFVGHLGPRQADRPLDTDSDVPR